MTTKTIYRIADKFGRQIGEQHATFSSALAARVDGSLVERWEPTRWVLATCVVRVRQVGQQFGTVAQLMSGRELVAETDVVGFGFESAALAAAHELAAKHGITVQEPAL